MSSYKIVRIAHINYPAALRSLYHGVPGLEKRPYEEQIAAIFASRLVYSDSFSRSMRKLGAEAHEIIHNAVSAQKMWARERGVIVHENQPISDIALHQIAELKPDVVYYQGSCPFSVSAQKSFRRRFPFVKLIVLYMGFPLPVDHFRGLVDYVFAGAPEILTHCQEAGVKSRLVYHGFDEALLELPELDAPNKTHDFTFIGTSGYDHRLSGLKVHASHTTRYLTLIELLKKTDVRIWEHAGQVPGNGPATACGLLESGARSAANLLLTLKTEDSIRAARGLNNVLRSRMGQAFMRICEDKIAASAKHVEPPPPPPGFPSPVLPLGQMFPDKCKGPLFGLQMYQALAKSKVVFNIHTDAVDNTVANMRMFEATGIGSCLLTDTGANMRDLFEDGLEVVTYTSVDDLVEKAAYLIDNDDERNRITEAGQRRTLRDHTIFRRCEQIDQEIRALLRTGKAAPRHPHSDSVVDVHVVSAVTTIKEARFYTDITLPNILSQKNQAGLKERKGIYFYLYVTEALWSAISKSPLFESLRNAAKVETFLIDTSDGPHEQPAVAAHRAAMSMAAEMRAALIVIPPDTVLSDGSLPRLCELGQDEMKYLALAPVIRVSEEQVMAKLRNGLAAGSSAFNPSNLARIAINELRRAPLTKPGVLCGLTGLPGRIYTKVGDEGFLINGHDFSPVMTWPRSVSHMNLKELGLPGVSTDIFFTSAPSPSDIHVVSDSNEILVIRLLDSATAAIESANKRHSRGRYTAGSGINQLKRLRYYYRLHDRPFSERWEEAENAAGRDIMRVIRNNSIHSTVRDIADIGRWFVSDTVESNK